MEQTLKILQTLFDNTEMLYKMSSQELRDVLELSTMVINETRINIVERQKAYLVCCVAASSEKLPIKERWSMYWSLVSVAFTSDSYDVCHEALEGLYSELYDSVERLLPAELKTCNEKQNGPVVIVTSQFIGEGHAPTRRVLDYATTIANMGFEVVIINDGGLNIEPFPYNKIARAFSYIKEYERKSSYSYKGRKFKFYQNPKSMLDPGSIANIVYNIKKLNPCLVFNVGASCITADLCRFFAKTAVIPCATSIATSMSDYIILGREIRESDKERIERGLERQTIVESVYNYVFPKDQQKRVYSRKMLGIPEDAWVIATAGNRMDNELTEEFILMLDEVMGHSEDIYYMIVGSVEHPERWLEKVEHKTKFLFPGSLPDGSEAIRLADVYIQPKRKGGGRAAFEALYYGIPTLIPAYGDSWDTCGEEFEVTDYEDMKERLVELKDKPDLYEYKAQRAKARADVLEDMPGMFCDLFCNLDISIPKEINIEYTDIFDKKTDKDIKTLQASVQLLHEKLDFIQKMLVNR